MRIGLALIAGLTLGGCAVGPDYEQPAAGTGDAWLTPSGDVEPGRLPDSWWASLDSAALEEYLTRAAAGNLDLRAATARLEQARAARGVARSAFWPQVAAESSYTDVEQSIRSPAGAGSLIEAGFIPRDIVFYGASLEASWELDLFGGNRRRAEAAAAELGASVAEWEGVRLAVLAETASAWFELAGAARRLAIAEDNVAAQRRTLELTRRVVEAGLGRKIDLLRAEAQLDATRASLPGLRAAMRASHYRLAVLTGEPPDAIVPEEAPARLPEPPAALPVGSRGELLRRRPDVVAADRRLAAATAGIGIAKAEFFPRLVLAANYGFEAADASDLGESAARSTAFAPLLSLPLFQAGRLRANLEGADARALEAALLYEKTVLAAVADAESALAAYAGERETWESLSDSAAASREAARIARKLYEKGLADFLTVLDADRRSLEAADAAAQSHTRLLLNLARLYKALGGGWSMS